MSDSVCQWSASVCWDELGRHLLPCLGRVESWEGPGSRRGSPGDFPVLVHDSSSLSSCYPPKLVCGHHRAMALSADRVGDRGRDAQRHPWAQHPIFLASALSASWTGGQRCPQAKCVPSVPGERWETRKSPVRQLRAAGGELGAAEGLHLQTLHPQRGRWLLGHVPSHPAAIRCHPAATSLPDTAIQGMCS